MPEVRGYKSLSDNPTNSVIAWKDDSLPDQGPITQAKGYKSLTSGIRVTRSPYNFTRKPI